MSDKPPLSRRPRYRETPDVTQAALRLIRSLGRRIATEDPEDLEALGRLDAELGSAWATAVEGLRRSGYTDGDLGRALGISKQAVQQRWPRQA